MIVKRIKKMRKSKLDDIYLLHDRELSEAERQEIENHQEVSPEDEQRGLQSLREIQAELLASRREVTMPSEAFVDSVMSQIIDDSDAQTVWGLVHEFFVCSNGCKQ